MSTAELTIDCTLTVNEVITRHPATLAVFHSFGLDACCGAQKKVEEAARLHGLDPDALCAALRAAAAESATAA